MAWFWLNIPLCTLIFAAVSGIPLWMVIKHPDTAPQARLVALAATPAAELPAEGGAAAQDAVLAA
jgi:hypothetical protein